MLRLGDFMAIRFYVNGNAGQRDGSLISNGDGSAPLMFDGMYPGSAAITIARTVLIRADLGEEWRDVDVYLKSPSQLTYASNDLANGSGTLRIAFMVVGPLLPKLFFPKIADINIPLTIYAVAKPSDTGSPDISVDIALVGTRVV